MTAVKRGAGSALYHQLYMLVRQSILVDGLPPGAPLPSEPALAERHGLSRVTVRRAIDHLERDGLVRRVRGSGTYVADRVQPVAVTADLDDHVAHIRWLAANTEVELILLERVEAPEPIARLMELRSGAPVQHSVRVRSIGGLPFLYLDTWLPGAVADRLDVAALQSGSLHQALQDAGYRFGASENTTTAVSATAAVARALAVPVASPLLLTTWTERDAEGQVVQYHLNYGRPDLYSLRARFRPAAEPRAEPELATAATRHARRR